MLFISKQEEQLLDPLSEQVSAKLNGFAGGSNICRFKLKEFVYRRAKEKILSNHPDWIDSNKIDKETLSRLVDINARLDYQDDLSHLVSEFCSIVQSEEEKVPPEVVEQRQEINRTIFVKEIVSVTKSEGIDKPIASGRRTALHIACEKGNFEEVVRLIEVLGACHNLRDSSKWTPKDHAILNNKTENHKKIIEYLDRFS